MSLRLPSSGCVCRDASSDDSSVTSIDVCLREDCRGLRRDMVEAVGLIKQLEGEVVALRHGAAAAHPGRLNVPQM